MYIVRSVYLLTINYWLKPISELLTAAPKMPSNSPKVNAYQCWRPVSNQSSSLHFNSSINVSLPSAFRQWRAIRAIPVASEEVLRRGLFKFDVAPLAMRQMQSAKRKRWHRPTKDTKEAPMPSSVPVATILVGALCRLLSLVRFKTQNGARALATMSQRCHRVFWGGGCLKFFIFFLTGPKASSVVGMDRSISPHPKRKRRKVLQLCTWRGIKCSSGLGWSQMNTLHI